MSYEYNYKFWVATSDDLKDLLIRQRALAKLKPNTRLDAHDVLAEIYARYIVLVNKLGYIFDRTYQVQKRALIQRLLEASSNRLLELKNELKKLELSEFIYLDKTLVQRKIIPQDIQLIKPAYFPAIRSEEIEMIIQGEMEEVSEEESDIEEVVSDTKSQKDSGAATSNAKPESEGQMPSKQLDPAAEDHSRGSAEINKPRKKTKIIRRKPGNMDQTTESKEEAEVRRKAVLLIQSHERARVARRLRKSMMRHPERYVQKHMPFSSLPYDYMHKPDQLMLFPVRRTTYDYNFIAQKVDERKDFNYYISPERKKSVKTKKKDSSNKIILKDTLTEASLLNLMFQKKPLSFHLLSEFEPAHAEPYFLEGLLKKYFEINKRKSSRTSLEGEEEEDELDGISEASIGSALQRDAAAKVIQRAWIKFQLRRVLKMERIKRYIFYGMIEKPRTKKNVNKQIKPLKTLQARRREIFNKQFQQVCVDEKARVLKVRGPWIMEDITDQIRYWFREFYDKAKDFHRYPEEFEGGTILLLMGETMTVEEFVEEKNKKKLTKAERKKLQEKKKAERIKKKEKEKREQELAKRKALMEKKKGVETFDLSHFVNSKNVEDLENTMKEYEQEWKFIDERNNFTEEPYMEWITADAMEETHKELRVLMDNLMRLEFEMLRKALAKDMKKRYRPQKKKKQKKRKRGKKGRRKKRKQAKDLTEDRSILSLYNEMDEAGMIEHYPRRDLEELIGDYNYCAYEMRNFFQMDTSPSYGEIKDLVREAIMGMGPIDIKKPKSICFLGPEESGKMTILNILASEIDAVMIKLTPDIVIKYEDKLPYLYHLVNKMARILQPTVIALYQVHQIFYKKIPKPERENKPRLLGKHIIKKLIKPMKKDEKVMVVGTSCAPWTAKLARMKKCFEKFILIPRNDYATNFLMWRIIFSTFHGLPQDFELSPLAMVTKGYKTGEVYNDIHGTLDIRRRMRIQGEPLKHNEFIEKLFSGAEPLFPMKDADYRKFVNFFNKVNILAKRRKKYLKDLELGQQKGAKKKPVKK